MTMLYLTRLCQAVSGQKIITEKEQPPYSPDLAPNVFFLFPKIKSALKWRRFQDTEDKKKKKSMS
jgi:hypothetical protein